MSAQVRERHAAELPRTKGALVDLWPDLARTTGCEVIYDALVLHYDAEYSEANGVRASQPVHRDDSVVTVNIALNDGYEGGGTIFEENGDVVRLRKGEALVHDSALRHAGAPTLQGERWALVVFLLHHNLTGTPDHCRLIHRRANDLSRQGDPRRVLDLCRCGLALNPRDPELLILAATAATHLGTTGLDEITFRALALRYAGQALKALPNSPAAMHAFAMSRLMTAQSSDHARAAEDIFHTALATDLPLTPDQRTALETNLNLAQRTHAFLDRQSSTSSKRTGRRKMP